MAQIRHLAIASDHPGKAADFYKKAFGFKEVRRFGFDPKHPNYKNYGERGITVCEEWLPDEDGKGLGFLQFLKDIGPRPEGVGKSGKSLYSIQRKNSTAGDTMTRSAKPRPILPSN